MEQKTKGTMIMTTGKSEDEIERERKAVQAMVGAKGAVEKVLARNDRLVARLKTTVDGLKDIRRSVGDLYIRTHRNKNSNQGTEHHIRLADYIDIEISKITELL